MAACQLSIRIRSVALSLVGTTVTALLLAQISCDRVLDPLRPFRHSTATVTGFVFDSLSNRPVENAEVSIGAKQQRTVTDKAGKFRCSGVMTGETTISISASGFQTLHAALDVTLEPPEAAYRLIRAAAPPVIETVTIDTAFMRFAGDPLTIVFSANDSSGGITDAVLLIGGDAAATKRLERCYAAAPVYALRDSFTFAYSSEAASLGAFNVRLELIDAQGDIAARSLQLSISRPRRPSFVHLRASREGFTNGQEGFISNKPGYLQVYIEDPDNICSHLSIDWGDGSDSVTAFGLQGTYWHTYLVENAVMPVKVKLFGEAGLLIDTLLYFAVKKINPPLLDNKLFFKPCQYCAPHDTVILIGVRILEIKDDYVSQIIWIVNENEPPPVSAYHREDYDATTGAISESIGNLFVCRFPTEGFKAANIVEVRVVDNAGNSSTVSGSFFISGKGR